MRGGGSNGDSGDGRAEGLGVGPADGSTEPGGRFGLLRKHWLLASAVAVVVLAAGIAVPLSGGADDQVNDPCRQLPASVRALADDPAAATKALDPGDDLARLGSVKKLLVHEKVCGDGARVLGRIVDGATRSAGKGDPHTAAQARSAYAVAAALHDTELPTGLAPGVARMLAEYTLDAARDNGFSMKSEPGPVAPSEQALPDENGWVKLGRFLAPGEAHTTFAYVDRAADADADIEYLIAELVRDPEAFAILYDAERANLAHYLERLTDEGGDPGFRPSRREPSSTATTWPDNDLQDVADRVGTLMKYRAAYTRDGTISDLAAFDRSVRERTRGTFRPADRQLNTRPPMGDIADRPVVGPVRGDLMDGRYQLFTVLDRWAQQRNIPPQRALAMRQLMDDFYVRALWLRI
ncbi:hypothetical protein ACFWNG_19800 [Streptomyces sp. NPDC058391]|uniref:hypothetical protein n=1 Tax=Streptomyces sp. NPDC058391 TaxID=3346476 RepID=UPI0036668BDC